MDRITTRIGGYVFISDEKYPDIVNRAYKKLADYEDTGLTPEQILAMDEEYAKMEKELGEYKKKLENIEKYLDGCKL